MTSASGLLWKHIWTLYHIVPVREVLSLVVVLFISVSLFPANQNTHISGNVSIKSISIERQPRPLVPISESSDCHLLESFELVWFHYFDSRVSPVLSLYSELSKATTSLLVVFGIVLRGLRLLDSNIFFEEVPEHSSSHAESDRTISCLENFEALQGFFFCEILVWATFHSEYVVGDHKRKIRIRGRR